MAPERPIGSRILAATADNCTLVAVSGAVKKWIRAHKADPVTYWHRPTP